MYSAPDTNGKRFYNIGPRSFAIKPPVKFTPLTNKLECFLKMKLSA
jgi:hypothetical protein